MLLLYGTNMKFVASLCHPINPGERHRRHLALMAVLLGSMPIIATAPVRAQSASTQAANGQTPAVVAIDGQMTAQDGEGTPSVETDHLLQDETWRRRHCVRVSQDSEGRRLFRCRGRFYWRDMRTRVQRCVDEEVDRLGGSPSRLAWRTIDLKCREIGGPSVIPPGEG
jgi:hypothetical protein